MPRGPSASVLAQFGLAGAVAEALPGGQRTAWRAAHLVLKPADQSLDALRWQQRVLTAIGPDGFRVAAPVTAPDGRLVVDGLAPAIVDFSPYWRPTAYASAIVAVDAVAGHGAPLELLTDLADPQMLVRALLFRILGEADPSRSVPAYSRAVEHVIRSAGRGTAPRPVTPR